MLQSEFENLTGIYPSGNMYAVIEGFYNSSDMDKHDFCCKYKFNEDGLAQKVQREVTMLEIRREQEYALRINEADVRADALQNKEEKLRNEIEELQKKIRYLQDDLDKELEWKRDFDYGTNLEQIDYSNLRNHPFAKVFSDKEAVDYLAEHYGFNPEKIKIMHTVLIFESNKYGRTRHTGKYQRESLYVSKDCNYIRFDCARARFELIDGELLSYETN